MKSDLSDDLRRLDELAFNGYCREVLTRYHSAPRRIRSSEAFQLMQTVRLWLLSPFSLWPIDFVGLGTHLLNCADSMKEPGQRIRLLLSSLAPPPSQREQKEVAKHEHDVRGGNYEPMIKANPKFLHKQSELLESREFKAEWEAIRGQFDLDKYRDSKKIIRRRMVQERSFRSERWTFKWNTRREQFSAVFDAFCHRWMLYGMEGDRPLLQKMSINITPYGTMLFVPHYWSLDWRRDLKWDAITKLHRAREVRRQGDKLSSNQRERRLEATKALGFYEEASKKGLKGDARTDFVVKKLGWHLGSDPSKLRRLLKLARRQ